MRNSKKQIKSNTKNPIRKKFWALFAICFLSVGIYTAIAQQSKTDSLLSVLKSAKEDTSKVKILNQLFEHYEFNDAVKAQEYITESTLLSKKINYPKGLAKCYINAGFFAEDTGNYNQAIIHYEQAQKVFEKINDKKGKASVYNNKGNSYKHLGKYSEALKNYKAALIIMTEFNDKKGIATAYNNIGIILNDQGNYPEALKYYLSALKLREELNDKQAIAASYNNIGSNYESQGNYQEALKNHLAALKLKKEIGNRSGIAMSYSNIGISYFHLKNYPEALRNHMASLEIRKEMGDKIGIASCYNNIGNVHYEQGVAASLKNDNSYSKKEFNLTINNYYASLKIKEEIGDKNGIASSNINLGTLNLILNNYTEAQIYLNKALSVSMEIGSKDEIRDCYNSFVKMDSSKGNWKEAYLNQKLYVLYRDSLNNEENTKKTVQAEMQYEFNKKVSLAKANQEKKDAIAQADIRKQKIILWSVIGGLFLVILFAVFILRSYSQIKKKNSKIFQQKKIIEEKQTEILDSIHYAARIQHCMMPSEKYMVQNLARMKTKTNQN
jgi:tetratricopeptide (TPR) repeat protein